MIGKGILIVEDENIVALDMRMRLESMGYRVLDVADSGDKAIECAIGLAPDLVLMDIKLKGGVDGIEAARQLRDRTGVPIIFVTAFTDEKTLERAKLASPYGYIVKPFHERELRIAIELALYKYQYELSMLRAKELAEEANRLKGEFMSNMSHELKTPLNSIIGFTELAMDKAVDAEQRELLGMALGSSKSLLTLIDSILDYTRMEAGHFSSTLAPFSLDSLLGDCLDTLGVEAYTKGLEVSFRRDPSLPDALIGDASLLRNSIRNLIDNAVKFTDRGYIELSALASQGRAGDGSAEPGRELEILFVVSDTGIGMERDKIASAFERFTQLDPSKTRKAGGTGLGLAVVRRSVELLGGTISLESEPGKGTRVELRAPFGRATEALRAPGGSAAGEASHPLQGRSVLVAGFDERLSPEVGQVVSSLGGMPRFASGVETVAAGEIVLADERAFASALAPEDLSGLSGRLVIATRFGGGLRSRFSGCPGLSFMPMPVRSSRLERALAELERPSADPARPRQPGSVAQTARRTAVAVSLEGAKLLVGLAERLERGYAEDDPEGIHDGGAEREIKELRDGLAAAGEEEGARLAFSALLLSRKGDHVGMRGLALRARELASHLMDNEIERRREHADTRGRG